MMRQQVQDGFGFLHAARIESSSQNRLLSVDVHHGLIAEGGMAGIGDGPARKGLRDLHHVLLGVSTVDAEGV